MEGINLTPKIKNQYLNRFVAIITELSRDERKSEYTVWAEESFEMAGYRIWVKDHYYEVDGHLLETTLQIDGPCGVRFVPSVDPKQEAPRLQLSKEIRGDRVTCFVDPIKAETKHPLSIIRKALRQVFISLGISSDFYLWLAPDMWQSFPDLKDKGAFMIDPNSPVCCYLGRKYLDYATMRLNVRVPG